MNTSIKFYFKKRKTENELPQEEENYRIPPLLFYTFVGNAFKHGITYQKPCYINVKIETGSTIHLHCSNSKAAKTTENKNGIGLRNIKQRLELIYPQQYSLNIQDKADTYEVDLQICVTTRLTPYS